MRPRVLVSCCTGDGWVHKLVTLALLRLQQDRRYDVTIIMPTWRPYEHALNRVVQDFLAQGFDYWLNIDDDNPPLRNPLDLVELDRDVVGLPTPVWANMKPGDWPIYFNALNRAGDGYRPLQGPECDGLREVDAVGSGCWLVARRVLEKAPPFRRTYDARGFVVDGPDFDFCRSVTALGFKVWAHFGYPCDHVNPLPLIEVQRAMAEARRG